MSKPGKAIKSVLTIILFTLGSKILGFFREVLIASKFGSGTETDTFFIALTATTLLTTLLTTSVNTTMIPVLSEIEKNEGRSGKQIHVSNLLNIVLLIAVIIIVAGWILSPYIIKVIAYGFVGDQFDLAVLLMRIGLPAVIFAGVVGVFRGYLQSELRFTESAASQFPFNFVYIFFLVVLSGIFGIKGLMFTSILAVGSQILLQLPGVKRTGYNYKFTIDFKDKYVKKIIYLIPPVLISVGVNDINKIIDRSLASTLVEGSISALNYANRLNGLILGIFITAITTVIFPMLSKDANKHNYDDLKKTIRHGINIILLITIPATIGMIILAHPIVKIAFERGAFDATATHMTEGAMIFYTIGLVGISFNLLLNKVFYSLQDTKTPMINSFMAVGLNITLNFILIRFMAHKGLALATSISAIVTSGLLLFSLKKKIGSLELFEIMKCGLKTSVASIIMGGLVYLSNQGLIKALGNSTIMNFITLIISASFGVIIYAVIICLFRVEEIDWVFKSLRQKLKKKNDTDYNINE